MSSKSTPPQSAAEQSAEQITSNDPPQKESSARSALWQSFLTSLSNNIFLLVGTIVTAALGPFVLSWAKSKFDQSQRQLTLTTTLVQFIEKAKSMDKGDTIKIELLSKFLADNKSVFTLETTQFDELLKQYHTAIANEDEEARTIKSLIEEKAGLLKIVEEAKTKQAALEDKSHQINETLAMKQKELEILQDKLEAAPTQQEKDILNKDIQNKQLQIEDSLKIIGDLNKQLEEAQKAAQINQTPASEGKAKELAHDTLELSKKDQELEKARGQIEELKARVEELYKFVTDTTGGTWIYLGWKDDSGKIQEPTLDIGNENRPSINKSYVVARTVNVRNIPTGKDGRSYVISIIKDGYRVTLSEVRDGMDTAVPGARGKTLWGKLSQVKNPSRFTFEKLFSFTR